MKRCFFLLLGLGCDALLPFPLIAGGCSAGGDISYLEVGKDISEEGWSIY